MRRPTVESDKNAMPSFMFFILLLVSEWGASVTMAVSAILASESGASVMASSILATESGASVMVSVISNRNGK